MKKFYYFLLSTILVIINVFSISACISEDNISKSDCEHVCVWKEVKKPTCESFGLKSYVCTLCETILHSEQIESLGHDLYTKYDYATCLEDGTKETFCNNCGYSNIEILQAHGHTKTVNCKSDGTKILISYNCFYDCGYNVLIYDFNCGINIVGNMHDFMKVDEIKVNNEIQYQYNAPYYKVDWDIVNGYYHFLILKSNVAIRDFVSTNLQQWSWEEKVNWYKNIDDNISVELEFMCNIATTEIVFI